MCIKRGHFKENDERCTWAYDADIHDTFASNACGDVSRDLSYFKGRDARAFGGGAADARATERSAEQDQRDNASFYHTAA